jgi:pSer/pThr/pTyr-binding forkhead associated (FHA) protein
MLTIQLKFNKTLLRQIESDKEEITIGRDANNDIQIDNMAVSGVHARIIKGPDRYVVQDLKSTNGTFLNEKKINRSVLKENDAITIGKHTLLVTFDKKGGKGKRGKISEIDRTWRLETERHKKMLKNQGSKK